MKIRVLKSGLTFGSHVYQRGDVLAERHVSARIRKYASGEALHFGERILEFIEPEIEPEAEVETKEPEAEAEAPEVEPETSELERLIFALVGDGESKSAIITEVGKTDTYTQREAKAEFERLMGAGRISEVDRGKYVVN